MAAVILVLGLLQAWAGRHSMQSDGISYLDMGDAIVRGGLADGAQRLLESAVSLSARRLRTAAGATVC